MPDQADRWCRVVVFYASIRSRGRAIQVCDRLATNLITLVEFHFSWWRLKYLTEPTVAAMAGEELRSAQVVLVATDADSPDLVGFCRWASPWLSRRAESPGLVAFMPEDPLLSSVSEVLPVLERTANAWGLDFLSPGQSEWREASSPKQPRAKPAAGSPLWRSERPCDWSPLNE